MSLQGGDTASGRGSTSSLCKQLVSFKPKNRIKPGFDRSDSGRTSSPEYDSDLAIVDF